MNKKIIEAYIPKAYQLILDARLWETEDDRKKQKTENNEQAEQNQSHEIPKEFRGYISSFGASITTGHLLASVAFFSKQESGAAQPRHKLMKIVYALLTDKAYAEVSDQALFEYVKNTQENHVVLKEKILEAAVAVKLAMNLFKRI